MVGGAGRLDPRRAAVADAPQRADTPAVLEQRMAAGPSGRKAADQSGSTEGDRDQGRGAPKARRIRPGTYSYTVLRYIHDVVSGEMLNIGVVMHAPVVGFLKVRTRKTVDRLKQAFPDLDDAAFIDAMLAVDRGFATVMKQVGTARLCDAGTDARAIALNVLPEDDSALQWSPTATGLTVDLDRTFERLYERFVARYDRAPTGTIEADEIQLGGESRRRRDGDASQGGGPLSARRWEGLR